MIYHFIRFKFAADAPAEAIADVVAHLGDAARLECVKQVIVGRIEAAHELHFGKNVGDPHGGYTHAILVIFENEEAYKAYISDPQFSRSHRRGSRFMERVAGFDFIDNWDEGTPQRIADVRALRPPQPTDGGYSPGSAS
jgi:hypothetical protein